MSDETAMEATGASGDAGDASSPPSARKAPKLVGRRDRVTGLALHDTLYKSPYSSPMVKDEKRHQMKGLREEVETILMMEHLQRRLVDHGHDPKLKQYKGLRSKVLWARAKAVGLLEVLREKEQETLQDAEELREECMSLARQGKIVLTVKKKVKKARAFVAQGNEEFYSDAALCDRMLLRAHPEVVAALERHWVPMKSQIDVEIAKEHGFTLSNMNHHKSGTVAHKHVSHVHTDDESTVDAESTSTAKASPKAAKRTLSRTASKKGLHRQPSQHRAKHHWRKFKDKVTKKLYSRWNQLVHMALVPHATHTECRLSAAADWAEDSCGLELMDKEHFLDGLFQLADLWTDGIDPAMYVEFLDNLLSHIGLQPPWPPADLKSLHSVKVMHMVIDSHGHAHWGSYVDNTKNVLGRRNLHEELPRISGNIHNSVVQVGETDPLLKKVESFLQKLSNPFARKSVVPVHPKDRPHEDAVAQVHLHDHNGVHMVGRGKHVLAYINEVGHETAFAPRERPQHQLVDDAEGGRGAGAEGGGGAEGEGGVAAEGETEPEGDAGTEAEAETPAAEAEAEG